MTDNTLARWTRGLDAAAISEVDRRAVATTENARASVLEYSGADALHAWGVLGRMFADADASPTLVARTVHALAAARSGEPLPGAASEARAFGAQEDALAEAALLEAFVAAQREAIELRMADRWRFPRCVVRIDDTTAAVAASFPNDDADALGRWADEVASGLAKLGVRRVHVDGDRAAQAALADALSVAGIDLLRPRHLR